MSTDEKSYPYPGASAEIIKREVDYLGINTPDTTGEAMDPPAPWALCLSGGGIRSATFSLGVLQGLARRGLLSKFHYLSTVSGGGYIGSWLTRWIGHEESRSSATKSAVDPLHTVEQALAGRTPAGGYREPEQVSKLRAYSNYLSPVWGPSTDFFTLISIFLRNLLLNWAVLLPLICALLLLPRLFLGLAAASAPAHFANGMIVLAACLLAYGIAYVAADLPGKLNSVDSASAPSRDRFVYACFIPVFSAALILGLAVQWKETWLRSLDWWHFAIAGAVIHGAGCLLGTWMRKRRNLPEEPASLGDLLFITAAGLGGGLLVWRYADWLAGTRDRELLLVSATLAVPALLACFWLATTVYVGMVRIRTKESEREWWSRSGGWWLRAALGWCALFGLVVYLPGLVLRIPGISPESLVAGGGLWGALVGVVGYWSRNGTKLTEKSKRLRDRMGTKLLEVAALVFILALLVVFSLVVDRLADEVQSYLSSQRTVVIRDEAVAKIEETARIAETSARTAEAQARLLSPTAQVNASAQATARAAKRLDDLSYGVPDADEQALRGAEAAAKAADVIGRAGEAVRKVDQGAGQLMASALSDVTMAVNRMTAAALDESTRTRYGRGMGESDAALLAASILWLVCAGIGGIASLIVGINTFSLHGMYGNRLVRAYFGAVRGPARRPHPFIGMDPEDNMPMKAGGQPTMQTRRLFPVINLALNLVNASPLHLQWQQRKAASFIVTPLHAGSDVLGYQPSATYADHPQHGISLGRAMTISGAAASSNMGYHSSAAVAFVMTFFNIRLGWWLPNPGMHGQAVWSQSEPRAVLLPLFWEAFGLTTHDKAFVYVSDGGHFDNMGLYEMVRRRCRRILLVDASADPKRGFGDLEDVLRKIRVDLHVDIELPTDVLEKDKCYGVGRIAYARADGKGQDGYLYYVKPTLCGDLPIDVWNYAIESRTSDGEFPFPHQSTSDQFFDERQFESYRMLGLCSIDMLLGKSTGAPVWPRYEEPLPGSRPTMFSKPVEPGDDKAQSPTNDRGISVESVSGLAGAAHSLSQGALLATAITVGGAIGVTGAVALKNDTVTLKPGSEIALMVPPGVQVPVTASVGPVKLDPDQELREALKQIVAAAEALKTISDAQGGLKVDVKSIQTIVANIENRLPATPPTKRDTVNQDTELRALVVALGHQTKEWGAGVGGLQLATEQLQKIAKTLSSLEEAVARVTPPRNVRGIEGGVR